MQDSSCRQLIKITVAPSLKPTQYVSVGWKNVTLATESFLLEFELDSLNNWIWIAWFEIEFILCKWIAITRDRNLVWWNCVHLHWNCILSIPEHSALRIITHSLLTIQFRFWQFNFSLVRQTSGLRGRLTVLFMSTKIPLGSVDTPWHHVHVRTSVRSKIFFTYQENLC